MQAMADPSRQVIVLTGASSGIGRATALRLSRDRPMLVLAARGRQALEEVVAECEGLGATAIAVPTDVTEAAAVKALAAAAIDRFGRIDVWINNAGVGAVGRFEETPMVSHRRVVETNLIGEMNGAHAVLPHFRERRRGTLINMVSIGGWAATPYAAAYTASKFALRGFSESLRAELADLKDVHVCAVYPTFVDTPGFDNGANYSGRRLAPPPPLVDPRTVADGIASLVRRPRPTLSVGSVAWPSRAAHAVAPNLVGRIAKRFIDAALRRARPARLTSGNLFAPSTRHAVDRGFRKPLPKPGGGAVVLAAASVAVLAMGWSVWQSGRRAR